MEPSRRSRRRSAWPDDAEQGQLRGRHRTLAELVLGQAIAFEGQGDALKVEERGERGSLVGVDGGSSRIRAIRSSFHRLR